MMGGGEEESSGVEVFFHASSKSGLCVGCEEFGVKKKDGFEGRDG